MMQKSQLVMKRRDLANLAPLPDLPPQYVLVRCEPGDNLQLARVLSYAFADSLWTADRVDHALLNAADVLVTFGMRCEADIVATASLRFLPDRYPGDGYLHWVGSDPAHAGRRLGRYVSLAALYAARSMEYGAMWLDTDDFRLAAIKTYLDLGFEPVIADPGHMDRWNVVLTALGRSHNGPFAGTG
jgi:mycothiol synthase